MQNLAHKLGLHILKIHLECNYELGVSIRFSKLVLSFQVPLPLLRLLIRKVHSKTEWSLLYPGLISISMFISVKLEVTAKQSNLARYNGFVFRLVYLLYSIVNLPLN